MLRHALSAAGLTILLVFAAGSGENAKKSESEPVEVPMATVGEAFQLDGVEFKAVNITKGGQVGRGRFTRFAGKENKYVVVQFEATNQTKKPITFVGLGPTKALDGEGREFTPDGQGQAAIAKSEGRWGGVRTLQPGVTDQGKVAFLVPNDAVSTLVFTWKAGILGKETRKMAAGFGAP